MSDTQNSKAQTNTETDAAKDRLDDLAQQMDSEDPNYESNQKQEGASDGASDDAKQSMLADSDGEVSDKADEKGDETDEARKSMLSDDEGKTEEVVDYKLELGEDSPFDDNALHSVKAFAQENKLSNEVAQKILTAQEQTIRNFQEGQKQHMVKLNNQWYKEIQDDPKLGGKNFNETQTIFKRTIKQFGSAELVKTIVEGNFDNFKPFVEFVVNMGKASTAEDRIQFHAPKTKAVKKPQSPGEIMYDDDEEMRLDFVR